MCNDPALQVSTNFYNWGCEVLRNLSYVEDLSVLDDIDLGEQGREVYSKISLVAKEEKSSWQAYATSVYFRVSQSWVKKLNVNGQLGGELLQSYDTTRRNVENKANHKHFFAIGILARYPDIDDYSICQAVDYPNILLQHGFLEAIQSIHPSLRQDLTYAFIYCVAP